MSKTNTLFVTGSQARTLASLNFSEASSIVIQQEDLMTGKLDRQGWIGVEIDGEVTLIDRQGKVAAPVAS